MAQLRCFDTNTTQAQLHGQYGDILLLLTAHVSRLILMHLIKGDRQQNLLTQSK